MDAAAAAFSTLSALAVFASTVQQGRAFLSIVRSFPLHDGRVRQCV